MEGVGDKSFRKAISSVGGFDEAVTEFISVPSNAHVESLAKVYDKLELSPIPLAAQIMGADPKLMASMAIEMEKKGAPRIDINCGCPSNTVTGRGAGSSLLRDPSYLYEVARSVVQAVSTPVTIKMRSGYEDISLFQENLLAAQESGVQFITLHPRTKVEGYTPPARWDLIAQAKKTLKIPVVGNGDILSVDDAVRMLAETNCDALMIGRGAVINPFIFHQIKAHYAKTTYLSSLDALQTYIATFLREMPPHLQEKGKVNKLKQLMGFLFKSNGALLEQRQDMLKTQFIEVNAFNDYLLPILRKEFFTKKIKKTENLLRINTG